MTTATASDGVQSVMVALSAHTVSPSAHLFMNENVSSCDNASLACALGYSF